MLLMRVLVSVIVLSSFRTHAVVCLVGGSLPKLVFLEEYVFFLKQLQPLHIESLPSRI